MKSAVIFCSGELDDDALFCPEKREDWFVVCADGGYRHAERLGILPDMIIGDCDSASHPYPKEIPHQIYPSQKDATDAQLCLDWAIEQGCTEVLILGGLGGRLDHEFSNYSLLLYALKQGVKVRLKNKQNEIWMEDHPFSVEGEDGYISFFPYGGAVEGFSIRGLRYELAPTTLTGDRSLTACNEFVSGKTGEISFENGYLLVMRTRDKKE